MQSASSRIWTRVAVSISYDDNHYTTGISIICKLINRLPWYPGIFGCAWLFKHQSKRTQFHSRELGNFLPTVDDCRRFEFTVININKVLFQCTYLLFRDSTALVVFQQLRNLMLTAVCATVLFLNKIIIIRRDLNALIKRLDRVQWHVRNYGFRLTSGCKISCAKHSSLNGHWPGPTSSKEFRKMPLLVDLTWYFAFLFFFFFFLEVVSHYNTSLHLH